MAEDSSGSASGHQNKSVTSLDSTHLFVEFDLLEDLLQPIKNSGRIKYTCLAVCSQYIALGASTGSVYIFQKETLKYLLQLTSNDGSISKLAFSRGCKRLAVVTGDSLIVIWELNIEQRKVPVRILTSTTHKNERITSLVWDDSGNRVFAGDVRGWVTITNIDSKKPSGLFKLLSEVILKADSAIVQLDFFKNDLLVSTLTRCHICFTKRKKCATVGTKLRDGQFGACYWSRPASHDIRETLVLSARPGSRIWEASIQGEVQKTHQFKKLLAVPPVPVVSSKRTTVYPSSDTPVAAQSLVFSQLHPIGDHFLLAVAASGLYILNLESVEAVFWTNSIQDVRCMAVFGKDVFCLHSDQTVCKYTICRVAHCAAKLFRRNLFQESLRVCMTFQRCIKGSSSRRHLPIQMMKELLQKVKELDEFEEVVLKVFEEMLAEIEANFAETMSMASTQSGSSGTGESNSVRLESGIHVVVRRRNDSDNSVGDHQDDTECKEDMSGLESVTEKSELDKGKGAGEDETDHPTGVVVEQGERLEGEHRSQDVIAEEENQKSVEAGNVNSEVKGHVRDGEDLEVKDQSEEVAQETDSEEQECAVRDGETLTSSEMPKHKVDRESEGENGKVDGTLKGSNLLPLGHSGAVEITGQSPIDTCHAAVSPCDEVKHSNSTKNSNSSLSSISKHVVNSPSSTHTLLESNDPSRVIQKPTDNQTQTDLLNSDLPLNSSSIKVVSSGDMFDDEEDCTDKQCHLKDDKNLDEFSSLTRTADNDCGNPKNEDKGVNSDGIDHEIEDEVFISSEEQNVESQMETSSKGEGKAESDEDGGKIGEDQMQQEKKISRTTNEESKFFGDKDFLTLDGTKVLNRGSGFDKDKKIEGATVNGESELISSEVGNMLEEEGDLYGDGSRNTATTVSGQGEPGEVVLSPGSVPSFLRTDSFSTLEEDAKLIAMPTRLTEKSKKLKKSKKAARIVDIGTVKGQNAKNTKVSLKSPIKKTRSSPIPPVSISAVPPSPPVTSPSQKAPSLNSSSPTRISPSLQLSSAYQNGRDAKSQKHSPVTVSPILQSDANSGKIDEKADDVTIATDGLANISHSFKAVTRSLSQKLNKKSPLKRFKSLPSSPQPSQEEESVLEVKVQPYSPQLKILEEATEIARFQLNDQPICNDTETTKATLTIWLKVLQDVLQTVIKHQKQFDSDIIHSPAPSNIEEHISSTDVSVSEGECEVEKSSFNDITPGDPHSYLNEKETGPMSSQFCSPSATVVALEAFGMEEELFTTCCQFTMNCFQSEIFQAVDEEKVEADRADSKIELITSKQELAEPLNGELEVIKNSKLHADSSQINEEVQFLEEFLSNDAEDVDITPPNQDERLLSTTLELKLTAVSLETDFCAMCSSDDTQKLRKPTQNIQRSSTQQEVSVLAITMEMETARDQLASRFVWQFLPLLDTHKVRDIMDTWTVREKTFIALIMAEEEISDDSICTKVRDLRSEDVDDILKQVKVLVREKPVLAMSCLYRMQKMSTIHLDMSDILHQCYPNIRLWEALQICQNGEGSHENIVNYMTLRMNSIHEGSRDAFFRNEFRNMSLRRLLLSAALTYNSPDRADLVCSVCEVEPIPLSNHIAWPQEELISHCINICRTNENLQGLLEECHHHGYWLGVVELLKVKGQRQTALDMVLKLTDSELLCEEKGLKPQSFPEWHQILQFLHMYLPVKQLSPQQPLKNLCVNCSKKMAESEENGSHEELEMKSVQRDKSSDFCKMDESLSKQEPDLSKEVKYSPGCELEENRLSNVNSEESEDCNQNRLSTVEDVRSQQNAENSENKMETSSKQTAGRLRDDEEKTQKMLRKSSSSSPEHSDWMEASPDHQPRPHLTWEYVANLLVENVGSAHALKVLQAYDIPQGALTPDFYLMCLQTASIEAKQKLSQPKEKRKEEILLTMHPLLQEYIESEITENGLLVKDSKRWLPVSNKLGPNRTHWGRTIDLNSDCQLCGWSLQSFKTDVCMYACGHTYHSGCTSGDSCVICS